MVLATSLLICSSIGGTWAFNAATRPLTPKEKADDIALIANKKQAIQFVEGREAAGYAGLSSGFASAFQFEDQQQLLTLKAAKNYLEEQLKKNPPTSEIGLAVFFGECAGGIAGTFAMGGVSVMSLMIEDKKSKAKSLQPS